VEIYGGDDYLSFSDWPATYLNNTTHTATSPTYDFTDCVNDIEIVFPIIGIIQPSADYFYFDYFDGGVWVNDLILTSIQNGIYTNSAIPNTATQFRFRLITNAGSPGWAKDNLNGQWSATEGGQFNTPMDISTQYIGKVRGSGTNLVLPFYYDISSFTINCANVLPIELIDFYVVNIDEVNKLSWITATEINNDYYIIENSIDGYNWGVLGRVNGGGNTTTTTTYNFYHENYKDSINYYRLTQVDYDGKRKTFDIIAIDNRVKSNIVLVKVINYIGQSVGVNERGLVIEIYDDGTTRKIFRE
jgi:hypothetical protein